MNEILEKYAREYIKSNLPKLTEAQRELFFRMYDYKGLNNIEEVIDKMPKTKLDWAMTQIKNTIERV